MTKLSAAAEKYMHGSCRHVDDDGMLVVVNAERIIFIIRRADQFERQALTLWGKLCFAKKPGAS